MRTCRVLEWIVEKNLDKLDEKIGNIEKIQINADEKRNDKSS